MYPVPSKDTPWQQKLENAQNVLFCKELFSQLAKEAVMLKPAIPYLVVGNQITATIFPGIHLLIALCHSDSDRFVVLFIIIINSIYITLKYS